MVAGRWILEDRRVVGVDVEAVYERARRVADRVWRQMEGFRPPPRKPTPRKKASRARR